MCGFVHEIRQCRAFCKPAFLKMSNIMIFDLTRFRNNFFIFFGVICRLHVLPKTQKYDPLQTPKLAKNLGHVTKLYFLEPI